MNEHRNENLPKNPVKYLLWMYTETSPVKFLWLWFPRFYDRKKPVRAEIYLDFDEKIYLFIYTSMCQGEHFADNL